MRSAAPRRATAHSNRAKRMGVEELRLNADVVAAPPARARPRIPMIRQVFYVSRASSGLTDRMVQEILASSRLNNRRLDVTGSLLFSGDHFAQFLEGTPANLQLLVDKIAGDPRHHGVRVLIDQETTLRTYADWSMSYL